MSAARALPLRVDILPGESADSWLEALARRHGVSLRPTLAALGLQPPPVTVSRLLNRVPPAQWRQIEHATGLAPGRLDAATSTAWGAASSLQTPGSRFCPQCLLVHGGRWKLAWRLSCTVACPQHRILLAAACPACHHPPRRMVSRGPSPLPSASCAQLIEGVRCSARLTAATVVPIGAEILDAERWVQRLLLSRGSGPEQHQSQSELHDLPVVMSWLLRHHTEAMRVAADRLVPDWPQPPDPTAAPVLNEPAVTAAALVHAQAILGPEDRHALELLERLRGGPNGWPAACPPGIDPRRWGGLTSQFPSRYLRVVDHQLPSMDRLRFSSPTAAAALPTEVPGPAVSGRARLIPQLLWSGWTARLLPPTGIAADRLRVLTAGCLLLPGHTRASGAEELARFAPRLSAAAVAALLTSFARLSDGAFLDPVLTVLCRIAEHLDTAGPVIDYQRRRDRIPVATIGWQQWRELALTAGAHPGDRAQHGRHLQAKRYLYQLLSGADLSDPCHELSFRSGTDRSLYTRFETAVATPLRRALHAHAAAVLADLGIDEPVTWSPPPELAEGLRLPGVSNMDRLRELVAVTPGTPRQIAPLLDVHIEHVRIALEGAHRPARRWKTSAAPLVWQREQEAARKLTPSFFHRELRAGRNHIDDLAKAAGLSRGHIRRYAEKAGINLAERSIPIDPDWLRVQYHDQHRAITDIAAELGVSQSTVSLALRRHGIPARPMGVKSRPAMITSLDPSIPRDIRAAVERNLAGWQRLQRFQTMMTFPTIRAAAAHLGVTSNILVKQLRRLENDIGGVLILRAASGKPHCPTDRGHALLRDLARIEGPLPGHRQPTEPEAFPTESPSGPAAVLHQDKEMKSSRDSGEGRLSGTPYESPAHRHGRAK